MNKNITATILIVLAIGLYFTVTESILGQANDVKTVNNQYQSAITSANQLLTVRDQVENAYKNLSQADRDRLSKMVPTSVDNIRLIIDLNSVALKHGFTLQDIKAVATDEAVAAAPVSGPAPSGPPTPHGTSALPQNIPVPTLSSVNITFSTTASYQQFIDFMRDVEANLRIMDLSHLSMAVSDTGGYTYNVMLKTYWLKDK